MAQVKLKQTITMTVLAIALLSSKAFAFGKKCTLSADGNNFDVYTLKISDENYSYAYKFDEAIEKLQSLKEAGACKVARSKCKLSPYQMTSIEMAFIKENTGVLDIFTLRIGHDNQRNAYALDEASRRLKALKEIGICK